MTNQFNGAIKLVVASGGTEKIMAATNAFKRICPQANLEVESVKAPSGINEQPVGLPETFSGALNRIDFAEAVVAEADLIVSVENGIVEIGGHWVDLAVVIVRDAYGHQTVATSTGVEFPADLVDIARERGFDTTTVGSVIAEVYGCNSKDPHAFLTGISRVQMLETAIATALGEILRKNH